MQERDGGGPNPLEQGGLDFHPGDRPRGVQGGDCRLQLHVLPTGDQGGYKITIQLIVLIFRKGCHYFLSDMELMEVWSSVRDLEGLWPSQSDDIMQIFSD